MHSLTHIYAILRRLRRCTSGVAFIEFAYAAPFLIFIGLAGLELTNIVLARMKISQVAGNLADVVGRAGYMNGSQQKIVRESDINDSFQAIARQASNMDMVNNGRIIVSSLEQNSVGGNWIHWQRCYGQLREGGNLVGTAYPQPVSVTATTGTSYAGMGPSGSEVSAPDNASAVMFVEVAYKYEPLISTRYFGSTIMRAEAAYIVRDRRVLANPQNPEPVTGVTASTC